MSEIIKLLPIQSLNDIDTYSWPPDVWLPFVQMHSEHYICKETGDIWHRFSDILIYYEDEDYPGDDLIEDVEVLPESLVAWYNPKNKNPPVGTIFQVFDHADNIVFEELITGEEHLYDSIMPQQKNLLLLFGIPLKI